MTDLEKLKDKLRQFAEERDWDQYHSPKNLAMALSVEVSELLEHFQWLTEEQSKNLSTEKRAAVSEELGDVLGYLIRLSDKLDIDLLKATDAKIKKNAAKYPAEIVEGSSKKYNEY